MDRSISIAAMGCGLLVALGVGAATFSAARRQRAVAMEHERLAAMEARKAATAERAARRDAASAAAIGAPVPADGSRRPLTADDAPAVAMRALDVRLDAPLAWVPRRGDRVDLVAVWGDTPTGAILAENVRVLGEPRIDADRQTSLPLELQPIEVAIAAQLRAMKARLRAVQRPPAARRLEQKTWSHVSAEQLADRIADVGKRMAAIRAESTADEDAARLRGYAIDRVPAGLRAGERVDVVASFGDASTRVAIAGARVASTRGTSAVILLSLPECLIADMLGRVGTLTIGRRPADDKPSTTDAVVVDAAKLAELLRKAREARRTRPPK